MLVSAQFKISNNWDIIEISFAIIVSKCADLNRGWTGCNLQTLVSNLV